MKQIILLALTTLIISGCGKPPEVVSLYSIAEVEQRNIIVTVEAAGIIEPETTVEVKSKASGEILEITADTGSIIEAGSLMV